MQNLLSPESVSENEDNDNGSLTESENNSSYLPSENEDDNNESATESENDIISSSSEPESISESGCVSTSDDESDYSELIE